MLRRRRLITTIPLLGTAWAGMPALGAGAPATAGPDATVRTAAEAMMRTHGIPGLAIAISHRGRHAFHHFGIESKATRRPVTSDTLFEIGSISKTFTATLATWAQSTNRLSLTDSPAKFLPELQGTELAKVDLLSLATHTAGGFPLQVPDGLTTPAQLMAWFQAWQPRYPSGTARSYANPSIGLLGVIAAKAWAMPFRDAMQRMLFPALGLKDTWIDVPQHALARYAQGYNRNDAPVRVNPGLLADEAYGVKTTARDLVRFVDLNIDPSQATTAGLAQAVAATQAGWFELGAMTQALVWERYVAPVALDALLEGNSPKVASETNPVQRRAEPRAPGGAAWINKTGSTNGFAAYVAFVPARRLGIVLLANHSLPLEPRVRLAYEILQGHGD